MGQYLQEIEKHIKTYGDFSEELYNLATQALFANEDIDAIIDGTILTIADLNFEQYNFEIHSLLLTRTRDPLYYLLKFDTDLNHPFKDNSVHIGISWDLPQFPPLFSRFFKSQYPNIEFHLVNQDMFFSAPNLIEHFDGWINPGATDTYPRNLAEFSARNWDYNTREPFEHLYQHVISQVQKHNIPYFGICAGAQHLVLHNNGMMKPVQGFWNATHIVEYQDFSLSAFLALTKDEKVEALFNCSMPKITLTTATLNNYAAISTKLGHGIILDATAMADISVAMAYHHTNNLQFATQYHIEELYGLDIRQNLIFNSFLNISTEFHLAKTVENYHYPQIIYPLIEERLTECLAAPTCEIPKLGATHASFHAFLEF